MKNIQLLYCLLFSFHGIVSMDKEIERRISELTTEYEHCSDRCEPYCSRTLNKEYNRFCEKRCLKQCATIYKAKMGILAQEKEKIKD